MSEESSPNLPSIVAWSLLSISDFILTGTIYGTKTFVNETSIHGNLTVAGNLSGKNFTEFYDAVLKNNTDEIINGNVVFLNDMKIERLNVTGKINGLSVPDDIVTTSTYQNISNVLNFITAARFEGNLYYCFFFFPFFFFLPWRGGGFDIPTFRYSFIRLLSFR